MYQELKKRNGSPAMLGASIIDISSRQCLGESVLLMIPV